MKHVFAYEEEENNRVAESRGIFEVGNFPWELPGIYRNKLDYCYYFFKIEVEDLNIVSKNQYVVA